MGDLEGGEIVFTGELRQLSRAQHREIAELLGGTSAGVVRSTTQLVVRGEAPYSKKKIAQAEAYGIEICDEEELLRRLSDADLSHLAGGA